MQQRQVRDLMRIRHGHVVAESATLREVAERLIVSDCDVMAITDPQGRLTGIVYESSVVRALMSNPADSATVQSIVSRHAESVRLDAAEDANTSVSKPVAASSRPTFTKPASVANSESAESNKPESIIGQKPTFLRGADARRVLWAAEDRL